MDYLRRQAAPMSERVWKALDDAVVQAARHVLAGRRIATVLWPSGFETLWDGTDSSGRAVPSGVYFLGLRNEVGRLLDVTTLVIER